MPATRQIVSLGFLAGLLAGTSSVSTSGGLYAHNSPRKEG